MHGTVPIPLLPTVPCPVCHRQVSTGYSGKRLGWHWRDPSAQQRKTCPGEGAPVVDGVASLPPEPAEVTV